MFIPSTFKPAFPVTFWLRVDELVGAVFLARDTGVFCRSMSYVFQFFCGPQVAQQVNPAMKKAGASARPKTTMVPPPRPRPSSAPPARPPRLLRDREKRGYTPVVELPGRSGPCPRTAGTIPYSAVAGPGTV